MITKYYINKAEYIAEDNLGRKYLLKVDYWNNKFSLTKKNIILKNIALNLLSKKHRVNLINNVLK